ncbi:MAG: TolC family outer membrane protein [Magnetococcales bacterium]|nr:TolC family outer membrane protein [Magnetococcales bacterium]
MSHIIFKRITKYLLLLTVMGIPDGQAQTLSEAVKMALQSNPELLAAVDNLRAVEAQVTQARAGDLPVLDLNAGYGRERSDNATTRAVTDRPGHALSLNRSEANLTLTQNLFNGFATRNRVARADAASRAAGFGMERVAETVAMSVVEAYVETVKRREQLELTRDNLLLHQRVLEKMRARHEAGGGESKADVQQTESRLALASANHAANQGAEKNARSLFLRVIGQAPENTTRPELSASALPESREKAVERALAGHPAMLAAQAELEMAQKELEESKAAFAPQISLELTYGQSDDVGGSAGHGNSAAAMVRMKQNLYRGQADSARSKELNERVSQRRNQLEQTRRTIQEGVEATWDQWQATRDRVTYLKQHTAISKEVTESYHTQFKMGKRTWLDVLNAENELFVAKSSLVGEELNEIKILCQLLANMGLLRPFLTATGAP